MSPFAISLLLILLPLLWLLCRARLRPGPNLPPGPWPLPIIGSLHMLGHLPHRDLAKLAQKYGPIMYLRLGQVPTIVVSSPKAAELFLKQHDAVFASRPMVQAAVHIWCGAKGIGMTPYGEYWRRVRSLCSLHLMSPAKVEAFEGLRRKETKAAMRQLMRAAVAREAVDIGERVGELTERIVFKMVVGKGMEEDKKTNDLQRVVKDVSALSGAFNLADFVPWLAPLDLQGLNRKMKAVGKVAHDIAEKIIEDHLKDENFGQHKDIVGTMLDLMNNPQNELFSSFNRENVRCIMLDLFIGGIETSGVATTWALSALVKHPRVMRLLQEELDNIIGKERMVVESDLPKLPYLDMVVKETFRLYPVAPFLVPHESLEDVVINGYMIPKKSRVIINVWTIGRDPSVWSENVEEFYPERFVGKEIDVRGRDFELIPFGTGRRGCPGMHLGLITVKLVLAQLVHCFDWKLPSGMRPEEMDMTEEFGITMPRTNKLLATPSYRLLVTPS